MSYSILNSAQNLLDMAQGVEFKNLNESVSSFSSKLQQHGASKEYIAASLKRISFATHPAQLKEAMNRELLKLNTATFVHEEASEDAEGKGAEDGEGKGTKLAEPIDTGDAEETLKKKANNDEQEKKEIAEHLSALFAGEDLSPAFRRKASAIFEAAVNARVEKIQAELVRQSRDVVVEEVSSRQTNMVGKIDQYLDYVVKNWLSENRLAVENGISNELSESFIDGLKNLFERHYIDVPKNKVDVVEALTKRVAGLTENLNTVTHQNMNLKKTSTKSNCNVIVESLCNGLAATQVAKFKSLLRGTSYSNEREFAEKAKTIREQYFSSKGNIRPLVLTETMPVANAPTVPQPQNGRMSSYFNTIGRLETAKDNNTQS